MTAVNQLNRIVFDAANSIFQNIVPVDKRSPMMAQDTHNIMSKLATEVDCRLASKYLVQEDGAIFSIITSTLELGLKNVMADGQLNTQDIPAIMYTMSECAKQLNVAHEKQQIALSISKDTILAVLEAIMLMTLQMVFSQPEYLVVKQIVISSMALLKIDVKPLVKKFQFPCCLPPSVQK